MNETGENRTKWSGAKAGLLVLCAAGLLRPLAGQEEARRIGEVMDGLLAPSLEKRLEAAWALSRLPDAPWKTLVRRLAGTGAALAARIRGLVRRLGAERWEDREEAEKELVRIGGKALGFLEKARKEASLLEVRWRAARALEKIRRASPQLEKQWRRERDVSRALAWALMVFPPRDPARAKLALRILETARFDVDRELGLLSLRALARLKDPKALGPLEELVNKGSPLEILFGVEGLLDLGGPKGTARVRELSAGGKRPLLGLAARGALLLRGLAPAPWKGPAFLASSFEPVPGGDAVSSGPSWKTALTTGETLEGGFLGLDAAGMKLRWKGRGEVRIPVTLLSSAEPGKAGGGKGADSPKVEHWVLFRSGTWLPGKILSLGKEKVEVELALLGKRSLPGEALQGWGAGGRPGVFHGVVPGRARIVLKGGKSLAGRLEGFTRGGIRLLAGGGESKTFPLEEVSGVILASSPWEKKLFPGNSMQTLLAHAWEIRGGGRVKGFLLCAGKGRVFLVDPFLGPITIPLDLVKSVRFRTGLGRGLGITLVSDLDESRVVEFNPDGKIVWTFKDLDGGPLDAKWLPSGNLLVCEEGGRVREVTREGKTVWEMKGLSLPYSAEKLESGNYLIADTGHKRVIEVDPSGRIVWTLSHVTPYDVQRLSNGNTLVADASKDRVIEVNRAGKIVWSVGGMPEVRDADRLPNGNTLIACWGNSSVVEVDRQGKVVWKLSGLETPSDADRLPGGLTLVAESGRVRVVDRRGRTVWSVPVGWAVEANRY